MIAKKYTDANDNPAIKVLASSAGRQWVGTETALDAALAAGTIKPGTVADTYMEPDDTPVVDYATVEYVRKNNKLAGWEEFEPSWDKSYTGTTGSDGFWYDVSKRMEYDGYIQMVFSCYGVSGGAATLDGRLIPEVQVSSDGGTTWFTMYFGNAGQVSRNNIFFIASKGDIFRRAVYGEVGLQCMGGGTVSVNYYKERDYTE